MRYSILRALAGVCLLLRFSIAGPNFDPASAYQRIVCVVPLVGAGTLDDPKRPMFAPAGGDASVDIASRQGEGRASKGFSEKPAIIAYHSVPTDDGKSAIVEFVARDRAAFGPMLEAKRQNRAQVFDRNKDRLEDVLTELRKVKKDFDFSMLRVGAL